MKKLTSIQQAIQDEQNKTRLNVNYVFAYARNFIESSLSLELSLIELVRLKEITQDATKRARDNDSKVRRSNWAFSPANDTIAIFLQDYYGIPVATESYNLTSERYRFMQRNGYDGYREFWKKRQEQAHLP